MKRIIALLLASLFILAGCQATPKTDPRSDFPGEKYATYYTLGNDNVYLQEDEYNPIQEPLEQPFFSEEPNLYKGYNQYYTIDYNGTECKGQLFFTLAGLTPKATFILFPLPENSSRMVDAWLDTGEICTFTYNEIYKTDGHISDNVLIDKANEIASKYIDVNKYEIKVEKWRVSYQQKFGELYLLDPFYIQFGEGDDGEPLVCIINLGRTGLFKSLDYDPETVKNAVKAKAEAVVADGAAVTDISLDGIDIAKFGVPVVCSTVTLKWNVDGSVQEVSFYTKISD